MRHCQKPLKPFILKIYTHLTQVYSFQAKKLISWVYTEKTCFYLEFSWYMKRFVSPIAGVLFLSFGFLIGFSVARIPPQPPSDQPIVVEPREGTYSVARVLDGDTIELASGEKIRYLGLDAPELHERWGEKAWEYNKKLVEGKTVRIELDRITRDQYGRILAYVWVGSTLVNEALVREGYARYFSPKGEPVSRHRDRIVKAEREAREDHRGLWIEEWINEK